MNKLCVRCNLRHYVTETRWIVAPWKAKDKTGNYVMLPVCVDCLKEGE